MLYTYNFFDTFVSAFFTFFATVAPINVLVIFMSSTGHYTSKERRKIAIKSSTIASSVLVITMLFGGAIFKFLGIDMPAVRTAGGLLLLLTAFGMMFGEDKEGVEVNTSKKDISVFPLAVPVIAGPAAITSSMLLIDSYENIYFKISVFLALFFNLLMMIVLLLLSDKIITRIKKSVIAVFLRIAGLILASLAVQFIFDGLRESKLFG